MHIPNNTFLITGSASGLGLATARLLIEAGGNALLADINPDAGAAAEADLGPRAKFVLTDVTDEASVQNAIAVAQTQFGGLHGVVNCAGVGPAERVLGKAGPHALASFTRTVTINLIGTFNVLRLAAAALQANEPGPSGERGVVITTASVAAFDGQIGQAAYAASKAGIVGMTLPVARELARFGIRVMNIAPGIFETPLLASLPEEARASLGQQVPFPARLGQPAEFAALARHIIENQMLNGETIRLDGAIRMGAK
ncbi:MAG TPA: SDR family NAD(P)-dependent oxidoreductase [Hymenobacter sp.]|jgi:NAD(P)-dependent dehydrogenase (short-subunit alcohol dehydrogenase family)